MKIFNYVQIRKSLKIRPKGVQQVRTKKKKQNPNPSGSVSVNTEVTSMMQGRGMFSHYLLFIHETSRIPSTSHLRRYILSLWWLLLLSFGQSLVYIHPSWYGVSKVVWKAEALTSGVGKKKKNYFQWFPMYFLLIS